MSLSSEDFLQPDPVLAALNRAAGEIHERGPCRWSFPAGPEEGIEVTARVGPEWVLMDMPLMACKGAHRLQPKRLWSLLRANGDLRGGAKFVVAGTPQSLRVRAEIRVDGETDLEGRIRNACVGFQEALACFRRKKSGQLTDQPEPLRPANPAASGIGLRALCAEAGWAFSDRPDGAVAVRLGVEDGYYQAKVRTDNRGSFLGWVELANQESWPPDSWKALAVFLLHACGHLKAVRAAARRLDSGATTAGFEVVLDPSAGPEGLGRAFTALSVACNLVGKEVRILREEVVGKEYLAMIRGWSSSPGQSNTNPSLQGENKWGNT